MTNAQIILSNSIDLMKKGILNGTGKFFEVIDENGKKITIEIPEEIHTFQAWKSLGYCVKKGEKIKTTTKNKILQNQKITKRKKKKTMKIPKLQSPCL